jgi:glycosyltransferase involved in cell wall biosynthesis
MHISVILCTFNRCRLLPAALESIAASNMPAGMLWEVLVVDNNSTDQTREVVETFSRQYPGRFRYLFESRPGKSYALNAGIAAAGGDALAFMDDDVTVAPEWLRNLVAPLQEGGFAGTGGRVEPRWTTDPPNWLPHEGWAAAGPLVSFDRGDRGCILAESPVGTNMAFPRRAFEQYGGFRVDLGPSPHNEIRNEDSEFARRLLRAGERLYYVPSAVVYHPVTEDRLSKSYFLTWWFDKGRSEIRESGIPRDDGRMIRGIPLGMFRRVARWAIQWSITFHPRRRFETKLKTWYNAGALTECHRSFRPSSAISEAAVVNRPVSTRR